MALVHTPLTEISPTSQDTSNLLWAASTLDIRLHTTMLDGLCAYLVRLVQQPSTKAHVRAQEVSNALWSLHKMRHQPEPGHLSTLLAHFSSLFALPGRQPQCQGISNVILAMAGLGYEQSSHVVKDLAHRLIGVYGRSLVLQDVCNVTWSMAVLNVLDIDTFKQFWSAIFSRCQGKVAVQAVQQLYQALYKLQPHSDDLTWQQLRQEVTDMLGPVPVRTSQRSPALHSVLQNLQLEHTQDVAMSGYTTDAVLRQRAGGNRAMLLVTLNAEELLTNIPNR